MKILFITLSNIGDCVLTLPVLDALRQEYPQSRITCLVPERPKEIFINNPVIENVVIFDKHAKLIDKIKLFISLSKEKFDLVIDMRNSFFGVFLPAKKKSTPLRIIPSRIKHMKDRHLFWAGFTDYSYKNKDYQSLVITPGDFDYVDNIFNGQGLAKSEKLIVVAPGSRSQVKCWDKHNFSQLCNQLKKEGKDIVLVGDKGDQSICSYVQQNSSPGIFNLCARTTLGQLGALLKKSQLLITNDSAVMHLASYLNVPVAAIFGPTDEKKYGPWSQKSIVIKKDIFCRPCEKAQCHFGTLACLSCIKPLDVLKQIKSLLCHCEESAIGSVADDACPPTVQWREAIFATKRLKEKSKQYRRILIARTDRIGDVLLSTPVIYALRKKFPQAYISMMVAPYALDIIEGNPYLDEVIIYDKDQKHKSWWRSFKFSNRLKKKKFDLAIILHPTNRLHLITFLAGIPHRLGYDCKLGFLLNLRKIHTKQEGLRHEAEYNLDLISELGIAGNPEDLFMPIKKESEQYVEELFRKEGISKTDKILAINPGASCPSKIWPHERFAQVAEKLSKRYDFKILILAGPKEMYLADKIAHEIKDKVVNLAGRTSISQLASILKRCTLFISNDSGPVHIACALGTPVISIFGRNQAGLSPRRWGPLGKHGKYLHKDVGCIQCLAHNCKKEFTCLKAISVDDVVCAAESILNR
ncbi:MAG: lipopolysaccharide heptosyltransferase II [Candidatus Omnitrophica bacterium]|nr:lipopolysaccharide heptosyltransferase II [Candidatus Omnitrophota bacterium]